MPFRLPTQIHAVVSNRKNIFNLHPFPPLVHVHPHFTSHGTQISPRKWCEAGRGEGEILNNIDFMVLVHDSTIAQWLKTCGCIKLTVLSCPFAFYLSPLPLSPLPLWQTNFQHWNFSSRKTTNCIYNGRAHNKNFFRSQFPFGIIFACSRKQLSMTNKVEWNFINLKIGRKRA